MANDTIDFYRKFLRYPMLKIGSISADIIDSLRSEASRIMTISDDLRPLSNTTSFSTGLLVKSIYDYGGKTDISHYHTWELPEYFPNFKTRERCLDTGLDMPETKQVLSKYFDHPGRIRISILPPNSVTKWHSHYMEATALNTELPIHIPLITNNRVVAQSGDFDLEKNNRKFSKRNIRVPNNYVEKHMAAGEIWIINPLHLHQFRNDSDSNRIHIWATIYLLDEHNNPINGVIKQLMNQAMLEYSEVLYSSF